MANEQLTMPYNRDAEMALLGCILMDSEIAAIKNEMTDKTLETVSGIEYTIYASEGIAAKNMRDTVYAETVLYDDNGNLLVCHYNRLK